MPEECRAAELVGARTRDQPGHRFAPCRSDRERAPRAGRPARSPRSTAASGCHSRRRRNDRPRRSARSSSVPLAQPASCSRPPRIRRITPSIAADGSSALIADHAACAGRAARQPAITPACVPPDDVESTISPADGSGRAARRRRARRRPRRSGVDAPSGITNGPASLRAQLRRGLVHGGRAGLARRDVADLGAEQPIEQRVRRRPGRRRPVGHEHAPQPHPRRHRRRRPRVIRLDAAGRDQRVGPFGQRLRRHELELADLVAAEPERNRVVALDEQRAAAAQGLARGERARRRASARIARERRGRRGESFQCRAIGAHRNASIRSL